MPCTLEPWEIEVERKRIRKEHGLSASTPDLPWEVIIGKRSKKTIAAFNKRIDAVRFAVTCKHSRVVKCPC